MTAVSISDAPSGRGLDRTDRRILHILQRDGRITNAELARRVHLSASPCLERVRRLEREGYITGYGARLDAERLGLGLMLLVEVVLDRTTPDNFVRFREAVAAIPEVQECYLVAGNFDYLLKVRAADIRAYRAALGEKVAAIPGVAQTHTYVVMEHVKDTAELPIAG